MQLLIVRAGKCAKLIIDARQNAIVTYSQLEVFLANLLNESERVRFIGDESEIANFSAPIDSERITCLYAQSRAESDFAISIDRIENFYYKCSPSKRSAESRAKPPIEIVKAIDVPIFEPKTEPKTLPRKPIIYKQKPQNSTAVRSDRNPNIAREEKALLLSSDSETQPIAKATRAQKSLFGENGRIDLSAVETADLESLKAAFEGKTVIYREIVEEENCPIISAEKKGFVESVVSKDCVRIKEIGSQRANIARFETLYSLSIASAVCPIANCDESAHSLFKQINFYFSDKNYYKDEFIQSHTAKANGEGMEISLLNNFPRVRRMGIPTSKLRTILEMHETHEKANYSIKGNLIAKKL